MNIAEVIKDRLYFSGRIDNWNEVSSFYCIVNTEIEEVDAPPGLLWLKKIILWCPTYDYPMSDVANVPNVKWLVEVVDMIEPMWKANKKILIHCQQGENRSGMLTAALLMKSENKTKDEAMKMVRDAKKTAIWNQVWVDKLGEYEQYLKTKK